MMSHFSPLPASTHAAITCFRCPAQVMLNLPAPLPARIALDSPAADALTDFRRVAAVTINPDAAIDDANRRMIENGIRLLLVMHNTDMVSGIITASDILGEKPMQIVHERGVRHSEIMVSDIMTPHERLEVIQMRDVLSAHVGNVIATFKRSGRQHAMVVEPNGDDSCGMVRGLFSTSQIARQLGAQVHVGDIVRTFSEIEILLNHEHPAASTSRFLKNGLAV